MIRCGVERSAAFVDCNVDFVGYIIYPAQSDVLDLDFTLYFVQSS